MWTSKATRRITGVLLSGSTLFAVGGRCALATASFFLGSQIARGQLAQNGGFESGDFNQWDVLGGSDAQVRSSWFGILPPEGSFMAFLCTGVLYQPDDAAMEQSLGLPAGALDRLAGRDANSGAAFKQKVLVNQGDEVRFRWDFATQSSFPGGNDFAFVAVDGQAMLLADFGAAFTPAPAYGAYVHTGFSESAYRFTRTGEVTIGFGVVDVAVNTYPSILLVDDVRIVRPPPAIVSAASRRTHGAAGTFDLPLPLDGSPAVEPRQAGVAPQIVLTFNVAVEAADGALDCSEVVVSNGTCSGVNLTGATMTVDMIPDKNKCVSVTLQGICGAGGGSPLTGPATVAVLTHEGDVNGDGLVNAVDLKAIKDHFSKSIDPTDFQFDVTVDGTINLRDRQAAQNNLFQPVVCP